MTGPVTPPPRRGAPRPPGLDGPGPGAARAVVDTAGRAVREEDSPAEAVASAVLAVPGVVRLHGGRFGEVGTYLPGRRVPGVRIDDAGTEVHVVVADHASIPDVAARVRRAVSAIAPMPVRVHVEDIDTVV